MGGDGIEASLESVGQIVRFFLNLVWRPENSVITVRLLSQHAKTAGLPPNGPEEENTVEGAIPSCSTETETLLASASDKQAVTKCPLRVPRVTITSLESPVTVEMLVNASNRPWGSAQPAAINR